MKISDAFQNFIAYGQGQKNCAKETLTKYQN